MTNFRMMITAEGKHPPEKWAELAADEIIEISQDAPSLQVKEAREFREKLVTVLTKHVKVMCGKEQDNIAAGKHDLDLPYNSEAHSLKVVAEICALAKGTSFAGHFAQPKVRSHLEGVCNRNFKSAMLVERHHYHSEKAAAPTATKKKSK